MLFLLCYIFNSACVRASFACARVLFMSTSWRVLRVPNAARAFGAFERSELACVLGTLHICENSARFRAVDGSRLCQAFAEAKAVIHENKKTALSLVRFTTCPNIVNRYKVPIPIHGTRAFADSKYLAARCC